ncbi:hypothetical protein HDF16_005034 [Granulicella aggregans]|uniref:Uncharacterized protein n=1 Tax=Granulicella aggregans TaxID=474949 RepID=A0A7W7ZIC9_9BACT|nr:hypothetical protein [Granulicella aggregans]MBB5060298.1 hypothetical protein [Granulicella aggregans]
MNIDVEIANAQRDQFAYYIVRVSVALGIIDGKQPYNGEQVAFLAEASINAIRATSVRHNKEYAEERQAFLDSMPPLRRL